MRSAKAADSRSALVGMQPRWRHVPPSLSWSTSATLIPSWPARKAAVYPPVPAPSTTRSKSLDEPTAIGQGASERHGADKRVGLGRWVIATDGTRGVARRATDDGGEAAPCLGLMPQPARPQPARPAAGARLPALGAA